MTPAASCLRCSEVTLSDVCWYVILFDEGGADMRGDMTTRSGLRDGGEKYGANMNARRFQVNICDKV